MSAMRISMGACAAVLLVVGLSGHSANAQSLHAGIKGLLSSLKGTGQSYATLANHLYEATESVELADNIKVAAKWLPSEDPRTKEDVKQLVQAFGSLTSDSSDPESFCSKDNLANLHRVAEGLRDGGNLGPEKITAAIFRLNNMVIKVIEEARKICDPYLTGQWPEPWEPKFSDPAMEGRINNLDQVAHSYLYEGYVARQESRRWERCWEGRTMSSAIVDSEELESIDNRVAESPTTDDVVLIAKQVNRYVFDPCTEFVLLDEAKRVLVPFNDLLESWFVVNKGLLVKYYKNKGAYKPSLDIDNFDKRVKRHAYSYQACRRILAAGNLKWIRRIERSRRD